MTDLERSLAVEVSRIIEKYKGAGLGVPAIISTVKLECSRYTQLEREQFSQMRELHVSNLRSNFESSPEFFAYVQAIEAATRLRAPFEDGAFDVVVAAWRASLVATKAYGRSAAAAGVSSGAADVSLTPLMTADWANLASQKDLVRWIGRHDKAEVILKRLKSCARPFTDAVHIAQQNWKRDTALTAVKGALQNGPLRRSETDRIAAKALNCGSISDWEAESLGLRGDHGLNHFKEGRFWFVALR